MTDGTLASAQALRATRAVAQSALAVIAGILVSGPIALLVVHVVHPQPPWDGARRFADELHWVQVAPYLGGFVLVGGCVALVASLAALVPASHRARANLAVALAAAFVALIGLNYVLQTTFVPSLAAPYRPAHDALIDALTMANPRSLAWALEMWGYAVLGLATWAIAVAFDDSPLERVTATTFRANAVLSVAGGVATAVWPGWPISLAGGIAFATWNLLMIAMGVLVYAVMRRRDARARQVA